MLKTLFAKFADMEGEHMETLSRRYHVAAPSPSLGFRTAQAALFAGIDNRPQDPANLLRIAIAFEERAVTFFSERGEQAPKDSPERELYKELAAEEREHVALLTTEYQRFASGKPGLM